MSRPKRLTDTQCRNAKCPQGKPHIRLSDGDGLYLKVLPSGTKAWEMRLWFPAPHKGEGKQTEKTLTLGRYPVITLQEAREKAAQAKKLKGQGVDPAEEKKRTKAAARQQQGATLRGATEDWFSTRSKSWVDSYKAKVRGALERDLLPRMGERPIVDITPQELLDVLKKVEERTVKTAHNLLSYASQIWRFAMPMHDGLKDITVGLKERLTPFHRGHYAAITDPQQFGALLRAIRGYAGSSVVRAVLELAPLVFLRPGSELIEAQWGEFDLEAGIWNVPSQRMKRPKAEKETNAPHVVYLSRQAVRILADLRPLSKGLNAGTDADYVFPSTKSRGKPISNNTINAALDSMGYTHDIHRAHGFRTSARTMLEEQLHIQRRAIEAQLAHTTDEKLGTAYDRTQFLEERRQMMQVWADYLDALRDGMEPESAARLANGGVQATTKNAAPAAAKATDTAHAATGDAPTMLEWLGLDCE